MHESQYSRVARKPALVLINRHVSILYRSRHSSRQPSVTSSIRRTAKSKLRSITKSAAFLSVTNRDDSDGDGGGTGGEQPEALRRSTAARKNKNFA